MPYPGPRPKGPCQHPECGGTEFVRGLCRSCYRRYRRQGRVPPRRAFDAMRINTAPCSVEDCVVGARSKGLCSVHYNRALRGADLHTPIRRRVRRR